MVEPFSVSTSSLSEARPFCDLDLSEQSGLKACRSKRVLRLKSKGERNSPERSKTQHQPNLLLQEKSSDESLAASTSGKTGASNTYEHELSKCKLSPPNPHICEWVKQPFYYDNGQERGKNWEECTKNQWCVDCKDAYHSVCDFVEEQLSLLFGRTISLDEVMIYNLWNDIDKQLNMVKDYTSLSKIDKNLTALIYGFNKCRLYRENQYKHCFRNTLDTNLKKDKRHQLHDDRINSISKTARNKIKRVRSAKKKVPKGKSAKSPKIRSCKR